MQLNSNLTLVLDYFWLSIQYTSCLSWYSHAGNTRVFFNFHHDSSQNTRVTQNGLHASQISCTERKLFSMCCMWVIIRMLHDGKKHASNASCAACESVFLCAGCKLIAIVCQHRHLTCLVAQYARVLYHIAQLRDLNWGASASF